jgi:L-asparagine transporter-like permease
MSSDCLKCFYCAVLVFIFVVISITDNLNSLNLAIILLFTVIMTFLVMWYSLRKKNNCKSDNGKINISFSETELKNYLMDDDSE